MKRHDRPSGAAAAPSCVQRAEGGPIPSAKNNNSALKHLKHPKGNRLLGSLRSPLESEIEFWSGHFPPEPPAVAQTGAPTAGPKRPSVLEVLPSFGLQLADAQRLGFRALEARAEAQARRARGVSGPEDPLDLSSVAPGAAVPCWG
eukprot:4689090-Pyramimonas_sp.AAC.1